MHPRELTSTQSWYGPGPTVALIGPEVVVWLDLGADHPLIARVWEVVRAGAESDDVLDVVVSAGLRTVPGFCLVDRRAEGRLVARGTARAWLGTAAGEVQVTGSGGWIDRELADATDVRMTRADAATSGGSTAGSWTQPLPLPVEVGVVLVDRVQVPVSAAADLVASAAADRAAPVSAAPVEAAPVEAAPVEAAPVEAAPVEEVRAEPAGTAVPAAAGPAAAGPATAVPDAGVPGRNWRSQASPLTLPSYSTMPSAPSPTPAPEDAATVDDQPGLRAQPGPAAPARSGSTEPDPWTGGSGGGDPGPARPATSIASGVRSSETPDRAGRSRPDSPARPDGPARPDSPAPADSAARPDSAPRAPGPAAAAGGIGGSTPGGPAGDPSGGGGHTGMTVSRDQLRASGAGTDGPLVQAARCPNGHISSAHADLCRVCELPMPPQQPFQIPRPVLGRLVLPGGDVVSLDRGVILGREPRLPAGWVGVQPHLVKLSNPEDDVSRQHVEIRLESFHVLVRDLGSQNGTELVTRDGERRTLRAHEPVPIAPGTTIALAGVVDVTFEVTE